MSLEDLDFQFLEEYNLGNDNGFVTSYDSIFEQEGPLFGNDVSLASTFDPNISDLIVHASTDPLEASKQCFDISDSVPTKTQGSPWHDSDSGMSETSYSGQSPTYSHEHRNADDSLGVLDLNVENSYVDIESDQFSPTSSETDACVSITDSHNLSNRRHDHELVNLDQAKKQALEFFKSPDSFSNVQIVSTHDMREIEDENKSRKNAVQAKINREKKKAYIKSLEDEIKSLKSENCTLKSENTLMKTSTSELEEEVAYLKSVLINSSALAGLLKNISNVKEVKLSATIVGRKRSSGEDHSYNMVGSSSAKRARSINENLKKAGVCLHVNDGSACLEFCAHCSKLAQKSNNQL